MDAFKVGLLLIVGLGFIAVSCGTLKGGSPPPAPPLFRLSGGSTTGPLKVQRVEITFHNDRGETTVQRNFKPLSAKAVIRFSGNGPFQAAWLVDDRVVELVSLVITFGDTLTLETSPATVLPTFEPGIHRLTLRITEPKPPFIVPTVTYVVTVDEAPRLEEAR